MNSDSGSTPSQETVGQGAPSVPEPTTDDPGQLGGADTVAANDELSNEEVKR